MKNLFLFLISMVTGLFAINFSANADAFSSTIMLEARNKMDLRINQEIEQRKNYSKIIDCALASTAVSNPQVGIPSADLQTAKITYLKNKLFTAATARACTYTGEQGGSGIGTVTFVHRNVSGQISKSQAGVNDYDYATQLANIMFQMEKSLFVAVDAYIVTQLAATESTVNLADGQPNTLNVDVMEVAVADVPRFYTLVRSDMMINNYDGINFYDIANSGWKATHSGGNFKGVSNLVDRPEDNQITPYYSNSLTLGAYGSVHYMIPEGGLYLVNRIPAMFDGEPRGTELKTTYQSKLYPGLTLELTIHKTCADTHDDGGQVGDSLDVFTLGITFAAGLLPLSNAGETMNYKYATLTV